MRIVHAASELFPFVKTGGLADAVAALTRTLAKAGHEVVVFLPGYRAVLDHPEFANARETLVLHIEMGEETLASTVWTIELAPGLTLQVIRRDEFFDRRNPYGSLHHDYDDNDRRFIYFAKAVVETLRITDFKADIVHGHDWQTGLLSLFLRIEERKSVKTLALKTVFTIHNLAFQGIFPRRSFAWTNLPGEFMRMNGLEYYGQMNLLKGGIVFSDHICTVSPNYSREILTPDFGCGLDGVLRSRAKDLTGLVNGIDTDIWNPATDPLLPARYSSRELAGKGECRRHLLHRMGLSDSFDGPVYGMVCRLTSQKGVDHVLANLDFFIRENAVLVVLGKGEDIFERSLQAAADAHPEKIALEIALDESLSHLIEAGSDFFLMPSNFEPCGLNQMYSQAYGTIPLVSRVGGLVDTVICLRENPEEGTGITFLPQKEALGQALEESLALYHDPRKLAKVRHRAMERDFSWNRAALAYEELYLRLI